MAPSSRSRTARKPAKKTIKQPVKKNVGVSKRKPAFGSLPDDVVPNFLRMMSKNPTSANWLSFVESGDAEGLLRCEQNAAKNVKALQMGGKNEGRGGLFVADHKPRSRGHFRRLAKAVGGHVNAMSVMNPKYPISSYQATVLYCTALKTLTLTSVFFELKIPLETVLGKVGKGLIGLSITCRALVKGEVDAVEKCAKLESLTLICGQFASSLGGIWEALGLGLRKLRIDPSFGLSYGTTDSFNCMSLEVLAEKCRNLEELSLSAVPAFGVADVARVVIDLGATMRLLDLRNCVIPAPVLRSIVAVCPSLRFRLHDDLGTWPAVLDAVGDNVDAVSVGTMSLSRLNGYGALGLLRAGRSCSKISKLGMDQNVTGEQFRTFFDKPKKHLKEVVFQHVIPERSMSILDTLCEHVPRLESLRITGGLPSMELTTQLAGRFGHLLKVSLTNIEGGYCCRCRPYARLNEHCNFGVLAEALLTEGSVSSVEISCDYACSVRDPVEVVEFRAAARSVKATKNDAFIEICGYQY